MTKKQELITWGAAALLIAVVGETLGMTWLSGFLAACAAFIAVALLCEFWLARKRKALAEEEERLAAQIADVPKWVLRLSQALSEARDAGATDRAFLSTAQLLSDCLREQEQPSKEDRSC